MEVYFLNQNKTRVVAKGYKNVSEAEMAIDCFLQEEGEFDGNEYGRSAVVHQEEENVFQTTVSW